MRSVLNVACGATRAWLEWGGWRGPKKRKPDIAKATALLGWEPRVSLEDGLRETVAYFRGIVATIV